jgi:hypothetical protein
MNGLLQKAGRYPHRLRAIGHLFEAEDESQAWPDLRHAIREATRNYQRTGPLPDFTRLANPTATHNPPTPIIP